MKRKEIIKILKGIIRKNRIKKAYLFGSFARGQAKYNDIDIAIEPPKGFTLLDLARMANKIEEKVGVQVDLVTTRSMHPKLKIIVEKEMITL